MLFAVPPAFLGSGNANAAAILAALVSWWSLDDNTTTPTYTDSHGSNPMTQRNSGGSVNTNVNSTPGLLGRAWNPNHTNDLACYIPRSNTALDLGDFDFSFGGWFKSTIDAGTAGFLMGRVGSAFTKLRAWFFVEGSDTFVKARYSTDGTAVGATVSTGVAWDSSTYHLVVLSYNKTGGTLEIRFRKVGGALVSASGALGAAIHTGATDCNFTIGEGLENDATFNGLNRNAVVQADECFYCTKAITDAEFNYLYNAGVGKTYANLVADAS